MKTSTSREKLRYGLAALTTVVVLSIDLQTAAGSCIWLLYLIPVLLIAATDRLTLLSLTASLVMFLAVAGALVCPPGVSLTSVLANRLIAVICLWLIVFCLHKRITTELSLRQLSSTIEHTAAWLQRLVETTPALLFTYDPVADRITSVNHHGQPILGYSAQELQAMGMAQLVHDEDAERIENFYHLFHLDATDQTHEVECRIRHRDGTLRWMLLRAAPFVRTDSGMVSEIIGVLQDITTFKQTAEQYQLADQRFRSLFEARSLGMAILNLKGRLLKANDCLLALLGVAREEFTSRRIAWETLTPAEFHHRDRQALKEVQSEGACQPYEKQFITRQGATTWVQIALTLLPAPPGAEPQMLAVVLDLNERNRASLEFARSRRWLLRLAETTPDLIYVLDIVARKSIYANRSLFEMLGYPRDALKNFSDTVLSTISREDLLRSVTFYRQMRTARPGEVRVLSYHARHKDGSPRLIEARVTPFSIDPDGRVREVIGISRDVTRIRRADGALKVGQANVIPPHTHPRLPIRTAL